MFLEGVDTGRRAWRRLGCDFESVGGRSPSARVGRATTTALILHAAAWHGKRPLRLAREHERRKIFERPEEIVVERNVGALMFCGDAFATSEPVQKNPIAFLQATCTAEPGAAKNDHHSHRRQSRYDG
jgi:hypothetical protein